MTTMTAKEAKNSFGKLIDAARRAPVTVTRNGRRAVVVISAEDYDAQQEQRWKRLQQALDASSADAASEGLTPERLEALVSDL